MVTPGYMYPTKFEISPSIGATTEKPVSRKTIITTIREKYLQVLRQLNDLLLVNLANH